MFFLNVILLLSLHNRNIFILILILSLHYMIIDDVISVLSLHNSIFGVLIFICTIWSKVNINIILTLNKLIIGVVILI